MRVNLTYTVRGGDIEPVKPAPPTSIVLDDNNNNFTWDNSPGVSINDHEYCLNYLTNKTWQTVTNKPVSVGNVTIAPGNVAVRVKAIDINPPSDALVSPDGFNSSIDINPGENYFTLTPTENLASNVYYALNSLNQQGEVAKSGDSIKTVIDLKGNKNMQYSGIDVPTLTGKPPVYSEYGLGSISFDNEPLTQFKADISAIPTPVEVSLTLLSQPGTPHEAWYNNGGIYAGDTGGGIRLAHSDKPVVGSQAPPFFIISNIHVKFTASRADLWVNGEYNGFVDYTGRNEPFQITMTQIGVHTNSAQWEFIAYHLFPRELTETERNTFFLEASDKFHWEQEKQLPYGKDGYISKSGNTLTAHYTYHNPLGYPEDKTKTIYRWVSLSEPSWLNQQHVFDGYGNTVSMNLFPQGEGRSQCKCEVQVFDTMGNTWKRIAGDWFILRTEPDPEEPIDPTLEKRITYSPEDVNAVNFLTAWDPGQKYIHIRSVDNLADQSYIIDDDNVPIGIPVNTPVVRQFNYGLYSSQWYNIGVFSFSVDLGGSYDITKIFYMTNEHSSSGIYIWGSNDGFTKEKLLYSTDKNATAERVWFNVPIDLQAAKDVKYIIFGVEYAEFTLNGLAIYGIPKVLNPVTGFKNTRNVPIRTFSDAMGTNAFLEEKNYDMIANTSKVVRYYNDSGWLVSSYAGVTLSPDQIVLFPKTSHMWDFDAKMQDAINAGQEILFCYKKSPDHLGQQIDRLNNEAKPTDPGLNARDLAVTSNAMSYTHMARIVFLFAARYGSNSDIDPVYDVQYSDSNPPYGLNLFKYFELGNEPDAHWLGEDAATMPIELAALYSAAYDGHKGAMGPGFGMKAADPNMKFSNGGLAGIKPSWFREMIQWWDKNRGVGDYPIDVFNVHNYNAWERDFNTPMYSDIPAYGVPPEKGLYLPQIKEVCEIRDKKAPNAEVWVTETGYDEHFGGMYSPPDAEQTPRSRHKAVWIMRTFLAIGRYTDVITQYWYGDDWIRLEDYDPEVAQRETFMTTGYVEGITAANDRNRRPMMSYWYIVSFKADMGGYYFSHPVVEKGVVMTTEDLGFDLHPELWVYAFKKDNGDSCLVAWMGSDDWKTHNTKVYVTESSVEVTDYIEHETRQQLTGNKTTVTSIGNAPSRYINQTITEYPLIIKTSNIGIGKLEAPKGLKISNGKLYWEDFNVSSNTVEIHSSTSPASGFTIEYSGVLSNPEYTLSLDKIYYKVRFINDVSLSDFSTTVSKI